MGSHPHRGINAPVAAWHDLGVWLFCGLAIAGIVLRPGRIPEWIWASGAALGLVALGLVPLGAAAGAVARGADVYAFLIGILLLAELGRHERVFELFASRLLSAADGSRSRLLLLVYGLGVVVTALLSNDTTVIVLTPAVVAALARTDADPLPYAYACAFVANAASFVLPISNPANLVVFGRGLPALGPWLAAFGAAAAAAIVLTYVALRFAVSGSLRGPLHANPTAIDARSRFGAVLLGTCAVLLAAAAALGVNVGFTALGLGAAAFGVAWFRDRSTGRALRHVSWQIVPLVAGLFVVVQALEGAGILGVLRQALVDAGALGAPRAALAVAATVTVAANLANNLPVALAMGAALQTAHVTGSVARAALVAVDLGPNLSITGSLATLLWLVVLRRDGVEVSPLQFLRVGAVVTIPALVAAVLVTR